MSALPQPLVTPAWLADHLSSDDLVVLDGSWYLPDMKRNARAEYEAGHIQGAVFADLDTLSDPATALPHMLLSEEAFAAAMGALGVASTSRVVVYDGHGIFSAPRFWWMLRAMGHSAVAVLDGGLPRWRAEGRPLERGTVTRPTAHFRAHLDRRLLWSKDQVLANLGAREATLVDARSQGRFRGEAPEPRPGVRAGHIPGSRNVPYTDLITTDGRLKSPDDIRALFARAGVSLEAPIVTTCGSGVTAAVLALALDRAGVPDVPVYDGAWSEWGGSPTLPIEPQR